MNTKFKNINKKEDKAKLIAKVIKYCSLKDKTLSKKQLELIANNKNTKSLDYIKVITDAKEFQKEITLINNKLEHSWAGNTIEKETASIIFGSCSFGEQYDYEYYNNGNLTDEEHSFKECNFNIEDTICIFKHNNSFSNIDNYYDEDKYSIIIYFGSKESYEIEPEIQFILNNFSLEEE